MQKKQKSKYGLVWFTNNLRIHDNASLKQACENHQNVIAVYCFDPRHYRNTAFGFKKTGKFRAKFLLETVTDLKKNLATLGITLLVYHKKPETVIPDLIKEFSVSDMYYQNEWTSEEQSVITELKRNIPDSVIFHTFYSQFLFHPEDLPIEVENIPRVFTDFRKRIEKAASVRPLIETKNESGTIIKKDTPIPTLWELGFEDFEQHSLTAFPFQGGETSALNRLEQYLFQNETIKTYKKTRNGLLGADYSSKFSPWLANGSISPKMIYWNVKKFEKLHTKNDSTYWLIFELIWRDFFKYVSLKYGNSIFRIHGILQQDYVWKQDWDLINEWINSKTPEAFVNANMLELKQTGWMSNRGRQNVASYFAKTLNLDWRIGASYFESLLLDYDVHSNYGNWMYLSGVGNDPRNREFNVKLQAERYDPQETYQNLWLERTPI